MELNGANSAFNRIYNDVEDLKEMNRNVLVGKKTINCLSCGRGDMKFAPAAPLLKGKDGGVYKGKLKSSFVANGDSSLADIVIQGVEDLVAANANTAGGGPAMGIARSKWKQNI